MILLKRVVLAVYVLGMVSSFSACKDNAEKKAVQEAAVQEQKEMKEAEAAKKAKMESRRMELENNGIAAIVSGNAELSILVSALKAADLVDMMASEGDYTVFAPTNNAFDKLPKKMSIAELTKEKNKPLLTNILKYHVVRGKITSDQLVKAIEDGNGEYKFITVGGKYLTASLNGDKLVVEDEKNNDAEIVLGNVMAANGIVHIISEVLLMK